MEELRPVHAWVTRSLYLKGKDVQISNQILHFEDPSDEGIEQAFYEVLVELGQELGLGDYSPLRMDAGRYVIQSFSGFSVVEIDPAWTEEQLAQMEEEPSPQVDWSVWGGIFDREDAK